MNNAPELPNVDEPYILMQIWKQNKSISRLADKSSNKYYKNRLALTHLCRVHSSYFPFRQSHL